MNLFWQMVWSMAVSVTVSLIGIHLFYKKYRSVSKPQVWLRLEDGTEIPLGVTHNAKSRNLIPEDTWIKGIVVRGIGNCFYDFRLLVDSPKAESRHIQLLVPLELREWYSGNLIYDFRQLIGPCYRRLTIRVIYGSIDLPYRTIEFEACRPPMSMPSIEDFFDEDDYEYNG